MTSMMITAKTQYNHIDGFTPKPFKMSKGKSSQ